MNLPDYSCSDIHIAFFIMPFLVSKFEGGALEVIGSGCCLFSLAINLGILEIYFFLQ